jgi:hypothetical protein
MPLSLTDSQLKAVTDAAALPPAGTMGSGGFVPARTGQHRD